MNSKCRWCGDDPADCTLNECPESFHMNLPTPHQIAAIYDGIERLGLTTDLQGWNSDLPIFEKLIEKTDPAVIVEIGSWKGRSAVHMALSSNATIFCVDFWQNPCLHSDLSPLPQVPWGARPDAYQLFLHNVKAHHCHDQIIPVRAESSKGAELLTAWGIVADLVYVDGGHDANTCFNDMVRYWPLLRAGGIMFGDDYPEPGVTQAVQTFSQLYNVSFTHDDHHWVLEAKK